MGGYKAHTNVDYYDMESYYRENVIQGPSAFVEIANDYDDFARAFLRKLLREIPPWSAKKMLRQERRFKKLMQVS